MLTPVMPKLRRPCPLLIPLGTDIVKLTVTPPLRQRLRRMTRPLDGDVHALVPAALLREDGRDVDARVRVAEHVDGAVDAAVVFLAAFDRVVVVPAVAVWGPFGGFAAVLGFGEGFGEGGGAGYEGEEVVGELHGGGFLRCFRACLKRVSGSCV